MKTLANQEQLEAINHRGGVLLSAGAGSGKTFVLVEHLVFLLFGFRGQQKNSDLLSLEKKIKNFLSSIVYMTFTNKAAGELESRIKKRIRLQMGLDTENSFWKIVDKNIDSLNITTIDGLCYKIINAGLLAEVPSVSNIIDDLGLEKKIEKLFKLWRETEGVTGQYRKTELDHIDYFSSEIINSLVGIYSDPVSRISWSTAGDFSFVSYFQEIFKLQNLNYSLDELFELDSYQQYSDNAWYLLVLKFNQLKKSLLSFDSSVVDYIQNDFLKTRSSRPKQEELSEINYIIDDFEKIRDFFKKHINDYKAYINHRDIYNSWEKIIFDIYTFVGKNYFLIKGATFSDLEYIVLTALDNKDNVDRLSKRFSYFVIDEFQDTSLVQYAIVKKLVQKDLSKLFCVGDLKQAIYGFRGGELAVFQQATEEIPQFLSLKNNYRSNENIIEFNNSFFEFCLKQGQGYCDHDSFTVDFEAQTAIKRTSQAEGAHKIKVEVLNYAQEKKKISSRDQNLIEARFLLEEIKKIKKNGNQDSIAVLFARMTHARILMELLKEANIAFISQVKIEFLEDPIVEIFRILLETYFSYKRHQQADKNELSFLEGKKYNSYTKFFINNYLKMAGIRVEETLFKTSLLKFLKGVDCYGLTDSFDQYLFNINLINPNYLVNVRKIKSIIDSVNGEAEEVWKRIIGLRDEQYSIDYHFDAGEENNEQRRDIPVNIMTVHASKGLEFDHILLAGIHTNGHHLANVEWFGKLPGSFKWKKNYDKQSAIKSPLFILEKEILKQKEFSESKRLFYVACTRAIKTINWVDIYLKSDGQYSGKNSWINAFRSWEKCKIDSCRELLPVKAETTFDWANSANSFSSVTPSFYLKNHNFFMEKQNFSLAHMAAVLSEVSSTQLVSVISCPFKFYLQNICKLEGDGKKTATSTPSSTSISSAERGIFLHKEISKIIKNDFNFLDNTKLNRQDNEALHWIVDCLQKKRAQRDYSFISEKLIKFPLYGLMITGIPDLFLLPKNQNSPVEIWDFKSGANNPETEINYWFQLYLYGHALYMLGYLKKSEKIVLILSYLSEKKNSEVVLDFISLGDHLKKMISLLSDLGKKNATHCSQCQFNLLCSAT